MNIDWSAVGAIAQAIEALAVVVGGILIYWQVRALRLERIHKRWEALQWAQSLLAEQDDLWALFEIPLSGAKYRLSWSVVRQVVGSWNLIGTAIKDGYVEEKLLFQLFGATLAGAYRKYLEDAAQEERPKLFVTVILKAPVNVRALELLKAAYDWQQSSRAEFKDPDMERWFRQSESDAKE